MSDTLPRDFADRAALIAYVRETFAPFDDDISPTRGGRLAAEAALRAIDPSRYGKNRNFLDGAVTRLSPYIRHGVLTLNEVRAVAFDKVRDKQQAKKLVQELAWHDYFQRAYEQLGNGIWQDREPYKTGWRPNDYAGELPDDITQGETGLACMDAFARDLHRTGYLHNHARMWLAAYVVHWRRVKWQAGARWFLQHLLDGDPASNNLSWQWVASTFSHKPYMFNRQNLEKYTDGVYCKACPLYGRCDFEGSYESLQDKLFRDEQGAPQPQHTPRAERWIPYDETLPSDNVVVWVHGDALSPYNPALRAYPTAPALWVWDDALLADYNLSLKRLVFLYESLLELPITIQRGDVVTRLAEFAAAQGTETIITTDSPSPRFDDIAFGLEARGLKLHRVFDEPFIDSAAQFDLKRFSRFWRKAERLAMYPPP